MKYYQYLNKSRRILLMARENMFQLSILFMNLQQKAEKTSKIVYKR